MGRRQAFALLALALLLGAGLRFYRLGAAAELSADEAASIVLARQGEGLEVAAKALTHEAWERGSADNATAVVVRLGAKGPVEERAVAVSAAAP